MRSATTKDFRRLFEKLPGPVQNQAIKTFRLWVADPGLPGLRFKALKGYDRLYSVRIGANWRAIRRLRDDTIYWFWIGSHGEYDHLLAEGGISE